ncbi:MAG: LamG domain-containing protein [Kiritimatiellae bacterium]|nr:LamG domain-containing protein [Kiritimatiellia bacterium]
MKRKQKLLVAMTALFCAFSAGQLWAATAAETTHLNNYVRIESITKRVPTNTEYPVATEVYFDVKLKDVSATWELTSNSFDATSGARPYLLLDMPLKGMSSKLAAGTEAASTEETPTAVAYYVGPGADPDTLRFTYVVRPGDMSTNITWATTDAGAPAFGGDVKSLKLTAIDTSTGPISGSVNLSDTVMQGAAGAVTDTGAAIPVSGYTFTVGDADDNNSGLLYAGLVPVTVTTIAPDTATRTVLTSSALYSKGYFWVEDANGTYYNVGVTAMTADNATIKEGDNDATTAAAFPDTLAAKVSGLNNAAFSGQKFMVSIPAALVGQEVRLCYGVRRDNAATAKTYAYDTYTVEASPVPNAAPGYTVTSASLTKKNFTLPTAGLKAAYTNLTGAAVDGGIVTLGAGETASFTIKKNGADALADYGTLYASIELISANNDANAAFERYYVPISANGTCKVKLSIGATDSSAESYYRVRVPALESANATGTIEKPFYIQVTSTPKRENITLMASEKTGPSGVEYYSPADAAAGQAAGTYSVLEYTLTVPASEDPRSFLIFPTDETYTHRIDKTATVVGLTDADGQPVKAYDLIASYASLQSQGGGVMPNASAELRVTVPAGETSVKFYVACLNDYALNEGLLQCEVNVAGSATPVKLAGAFFIAKSCNSAGEVTGLLDECAPIMPMVTNRVPTIINASAPSNAATGSAASFTFTVADTKSDYLVLMLNYGDGTSSSVLLANEKRMAALLGKAAWEAKYAALKTSYGTGPDKDLPIVDRTLDTQSYTFTHTYTGGAAPTWTFTVIDSSQMQASQQGTLALDTAQNFIFNTIYNPTLPTSGYILWDNGADSLANWTFGSTYTSNALSKSGGNTLLTVMAKPFPAGYLLANPGDAATLNRYKGLSDSRDSFFYKWSANSDFEGLLPTGATEEYRRYEEILSFNRAYVKDGEAEDPTKWQDIQLSAIFVAEYLPGDSITTRSKDSYKPYLYELGDYNQDGVPDGWILSHMGETARTSLIEGTSVATASPGAMEYLPRSGFGGGDAAYRFGASDGRLTYSGAGPCVMTDGSAPFGYKTRIRGRDDALNAADGEGNWLSMPAWVVLMHPEEADGIVKAGTLANGIFTPAWNQVRLFSQVVSPVAGVIVALTEANKIPYDTATIDGDWACVVDDAGYPIKAGAGKYKANTMMVCVNPASPDYEAFRYTYDQWGVRDAEDVWTLVSTEAGAIFPFTTKAEADAAMAGNVDAYTGATYGGAYRFVDARAVAGMLLDEPFKRAKNAKDVFDPRLTSWLDRFPVSGNGAPTDTDGDGVPNAAEYYFWYYASRIAYGSVYKNDAGVQLNTALWPAIDLRNRKEINTDGRYGTTEQFTMGRRFRAEYDPDSTTAGFYGAPENDADYAGVDALQYEILPHAGNASHGKGNYWETIPVEQVMEAFDPFAELNARDYGDLDNDGLSIAEELAIGTNPIDCDTDNDWMIDGWEVKYGLDPFNIVDPSNPNDAEKNPDGDAFAHAPVLLYPDYHHLFKVTYEDQDDPELTAMVAYYDVESNALRFFGVEPADVDDRKEANVEKTLAWDDTVAAKVTAWAAEKPIFLQMTPEFRFLRDFEVYRAFGFNSKTAVNEYSGLRTKPFVSREEFNSALKRGDWTKIASSPVKADTNDDGVPDGWALYVNARPHAISPQQDGASDPDGDGLTTAQEYAYGAETGWTNKKAPTDPWNPDTDFDGLWDGDEGSTRFQYGTPITSARTYIAGGGCDPNDADTDGDGMSDAWEYRYGKPPVLSAGDEEFTYVLNGVTVCYTEAPDPTRAGADDAFKRMSDYDLDGDGDGLTNYQEYLTATLRHLRYDLSPDMARIYLESPGELQNATISANPMEWKTLPDCYNAATDLANPGAVSSFEFMMGQSHTFINGDTTTYVMDAENALVPLMAQSIASFDPAYTQAWPIGSPTRDMVKANYAAAITEAYNYNWTSTIAFPTLQELTDYKLTSADIDKLTSLDGLLVASRVQALATSFAELDMAWKRLLSCSPFGSNLSVEDGILGSFSVPTVASGMMGYDEQAYRDCTIRQIRALIANIDELLATLESGTDMQPVLADLLKQGGDTQTIWAARKNQILKTLVATFFQADSIAAIDPAYAVVTVRSNGAYTLTDDTDYTSAQAADMTAYEAAVWNATNPLLKAHYRTAVRGFNGGVWNIDSGNFYGPVAWHGAMSPFAERKDKIDSGSTVLGVPILSIGALSPLGAAAFPGWDSPAETMLTTSPLVADTDFDGMDDYFEIFHGLNPVLGDFLNAAEENNFLDYTGVDRLKTAYAAQAGNPAVVTSALSPITNGFGNLASSISAVTGFDYYTYPWMAGVPFADPDGDGLLNSEEAVNPVTSAPAHYGTDPSALWMTDPVNVNSFVSRFYTRVNPQYKLAAGMAPDTFVTYHLVAGDDFPGTNGSLFPYEVNEGYDTDGDGVSDVVELTSNSIFRGDPQTLRTPDRQQAAYFGGEGVLQTMADTQFGPQALTTFTVECWVKPDADQATNEVILIDRPWRFNDGADTAGALRHNFVLGLRKDGAAFRPFAYYTGSGTNTDGTESAPQASPEVIAGQTIAADAWNHVAVTYDGTRLTLVLNGVESASQTSGLIPANGVLSVKSTVDSDVRRFSYRKAPLMIGATPAQAWTASLGNPEDQKTYADYFTNSFKGFIDEVRIWNGARTASQIADARARALTQSELLMLRNNAFIARYNGMGYYQANTPAEPLAIYTFNDLLSGSREAATTSAPATAADTAWERYPGEKLTGDATVPGSFMYRRKGFRDTLGGAGEEGNARITAANMPAETDLFTSYYTLQAAPNLRSTQYKEGDGAKGPLSEFVPMAHNTVAHLPIADVERDQVYRYMAMTLNNGSPELTFPSGSSENLKVADSFYWSPYRAGQQISFEPAYSVKTVGNPYAYLYHGTIYFDLQDYKVRPAFSTQVPTDLLIYGDVFAKYDFETWDNSPTTDPAAGKTDSESVTEGPNWFRHQDTPKADTGDKLNDKQYSQGAYWLEQNIANGQTKDSDGDRMPNWWENYYGLAPEDPAGVNGPHGDQDGDFLTNYAEHLASANPLKFSTVGNGVSDYQIPMWFRRGAPTFGLLYTDNDFMEDHWEASNRTERLTVDLHDAMRDADGDGWSNFAEARANFRSGYHSTNPNAATSISQTGKITLEMPKPALQITVDYFGDQNVYTNATANAKIVVHTYTAKNNNSAPDATFKLPLALGENEEQETVEHEIGAWKRGTMSGYLHIGNIAPGSLKIKFTRMAVDSPYDDEEKDKDYLYFNILSDTTTNNNVADLYSLEPVYWTDEEGKTVANGYDRRKAGTINYSTGEYFIDFSDEEIWSDRGYTLDDEGNLTMYNRTEFVGVASYKYGVVAGKSNTFTLVNPDSGYMKEGLNNFFVFADLDADGKWDEGEPAGIPDQHDVDVGFDRINEVLHVALSEQAPPGAVRLDVASILGVLMTENDTNTEISGDLSSIINPSTQKPLNPSYFASEQNYWLLLTAYENIGQTTTKEDPGVEVYRKQFNVNKPYLSEDEIFGNAETKTGLPRSQAENQVAASYKVYLLPETQLGNHETWLYYNIAVVTNVFGSLDAASTALVAPAGGAYLHNTDITFEWKCNVQVPAFGLTITKTADGAGNPVNKVVFSDDDIRGVTPTATASGTGAVEQFVYSYKLPRGVGELNAARDTVFGDGAYTYTLKLQPYSGSATTLTGNFNLQLNASGDAALAEIEGAVQDTTFNAQDSYYVRAQVRYNGVLKTAEDFDYQNLVVEAHYSGSFNGNPVASTTDKLVYDADNATVAALNRCVKMVKDKEDGEFFSTRFDVELRGLATSKPVYLMAYFDLNGNGKRDTWEPWGYAAQGLDAVGGFYFDPLAVTPQSSGMTYQVEFYIQDVDTDNDKLSDAWEWLQNGQQNTGSFFDDGTENSGWCNVFTGSYTNLTASSAIWTTNANGQLALTAYGAQLYGLNVEGTPDANGAVKIEGVEDMAAAKELLDLLGNETALELIQQGITSYGLTVSTITYSGDAVTLAWTVDSAVGTDGSVYDLTAVFAEGNNTAATYAVYGTATLGGTWTKLAEVKVSGTQTPAVEIPASSTVITKADGTTEQATFFKVILSAAPLATTLE